MLYGRGAREEKRVAELAGAYLACRVTTRIEGDRAGAAPLRYLFRTGDGLAKPDLDVKLSFAGGPTLSASGPKDSFEMFLTAPLVRLRKGQTVSVSLYDRDVLGRKLLTKIKKRFGGRLPWAFSGKGAKVHCVELAPREVEERGLEALKAADPRIDKAIGQARVVSSGRHWGFEDELRDMAEALVPAAAFLGWADPRIGRRLEWMGRVETRLRAAAAKKTKELQAKAPGGPGAPPVNLKGLELRLISSSCDAKVVRPLRRRASMSGKKPLKRSGCVVELEVKNAGAEPVEIDSFMSDLGPFNSMAFLTADGRAVTGWLFAQRQGKRWTDKDLAPGKVARIFLTPHEPLALDGPKAALLLALYPKEIPRRASLLRLR